MRSPLTSFKIKGKISGDAETGFNLTLNNTETILTDVSIGKGFDNFTMKIKYDRGKVLVLNYKVLVLNYK